MPTIRVRQVSDGEELVLAEEFFEARLGLGQIDPRALNLERRDSALTDTPPLRKPAGAPRLRPKTRDRTA